MEPPASLEDRRVYAIELVRNFGSARHGAWPGAGTQCAYFTDHATNLPASACTNEVSRTASRRHGGERELERLRGDRLFVHVGLGLVEVPTVDCIVTPTSYSAFWVGLDGYSSKTVEQIGTEADCKGATPSYYAWYEFYPKFPVINVLPIKPN